MCQEQQQNSGRLVQISKQILEFIDTNTKFSGHYEQGLQGIWMSSRLPRITELPSIQNQGAPNMIGNTAEPSVNCLLSETLGLNTKGIPNQITT
jgi:hypothetical protein